MAIRTIWAPLSTHVNKQAQAQHSPRQCWQQLLEEFSAPANGKTTVGLLA